MPGTDENAPAASAGYRSLGAHGGSPEACGRPGALPASPFQRPPAFDAAHPQSAAGAAAGSATPLRQPALGRSPLGPRPCGSSAGGSSPSASDASPARAALSRLNETPQTERTKATCGDICALRCELQEVGGNIDFRTADLHGRVSAGCLLAWLEVHQAALWLAGWLSGRLSWPVCSSLVAWLYTAPDL